MSIHSNVSRPMVIFLLLVWSLSAIAWRSHSGLDETEPPPWPELCVESSLDEPRFQLTLTCLPENWNGGLVVYAHGYVRPQEPLALPVEELAQATLPDGRSVVDVLVAEGFGFATTSYSRNGYAVEVAGADIEALISHFESAVAPGPVDPVVLAGASEGGLIVTMLLEQDPQSFAAALAFCGPIGGAPYQVNYLGDFRVVFDVAYPDVFPFGAADVPNDAYLDWDTEYAPAIEAVVRGNPARAKQVLDVTAAAYVNGDVGTAVNTSLAVLGYSIFGTNDIVGLADGEFPFDNTRTIYRGSVHDQLLNLRVERVDGDRSYLFDHYETQGNLLRPLIAVHTTLDELVPFRHELIYRQKVLDRGRGPLLSVLPIDQYGHCNFTPEQTIGAYGTVLSEVGHALSRELAEMKSSLPAPLR